MGMCREQRMNQGVAMCSAPTCCYPAHVHGRPRSRRMWEYRGRPLIYGARLSSGNVHLELPRPEGCFLHPAAHGCTRPRIKAATLTHSVSKSLPTLGLVQTQTSTAVTCGSCALQPAERCPGARKSRGEDQCAYVGQVPA